MFVAAAGKLVAYDTDGDGDFDVEDAKVLLGKFSILCHDDDVGVCNQFLVTHTMLKTDITSHTLHTHTMSKWDKNDPQHSENVAHAAFLFSGFQKHLEP